MPEAAVTLLYPELGGDSLAIRQDGDPITRTELRDRASCLADLLSSQGRVRVAITSPRADCVAAAIMASQAAGCEILLLRSSPPRNSELWRLWGVSALIDERRGLVPMDGGDPAPEGFRVLVATSGTTGVPKVARHNLHALLGRIRQRPKGHETIRWLLTYSPASFAGLQVLLTALISGDECIAIAEPTVATLTRAALSWLPTHISATPTFWRSFLIAAGREAAQIPLTQITLGGEVADQSILDHLRAAFPTTRITHIYATTEAGALFAVNDGRAGFPAHWLASGIEGVCLRIVDGVLEVKSPNAMRGYLTPEGRPSFTADGWLRTGDLVTVQDHRVYFLGRVDTAISVGGAKVTPEEVECVLLQVPGVIEGRVFGIPNVITGSVVAAEIVSGVPNHDNLRRTIVAHLTARLEPYKIPRILRFVQFIPTSPSGKKTRFDKDL